MVAAELGFDGVTPNSIDAVSNRDFILDYLSRRGTCATHLSRLGAELVLWSSEEFGFVMLSDAWTTGSSIMPQKKNPDAAELLRGKAPRVVGHLAALHGVMHAPAADVQQGPAGGQGAPLRRGRHARALPRRRDRDDPRRDVRPRPMPAAASDELIAATDIADLLVERGVPFRESHGIVGGTRARRRRHRPHARRLHARELEPRPSSWTPRSRGAGPELVARVEGQRGRDLAGPRPRAARARARDCSLAERRWPTARCPRVLRRPVVEVARDLVGCSIATRTPRRHRGDRGLPRRRAGLPRLRRPDAAHEAAVRRARASPTSTAPTAFTRC